MPKVNLSECTFNTLRIWFEWVSADEFYGKDIQERSDEDESIPTQAQKENEDSDCDAKMKSDTSKNESLSQENSSTSTDTYVITLAVVDNATGEPSISDYAEVPYMCESILFSMISRHVGNELRVTIFKCKFENKTSTDRPVAKCLSVWPNVSPTLQRGQLEEPDLRLSSEPECIYAQSFDDIFKTYTIKIANFTMPKWQSSVDQYLSSADSDSDADCDDLTQRLPTLKQLKFYCEVFQSLQMFSFSASNFTRYYVDVHTPFADWLADNEMRFLWTVTPKRFYSNIESHELIIRSLKHALFLLPVHGTHVSLLPCTETRFCFNLAEALKTYTYKFTDPDKHTHISADTHLHAHTHTDKSDNAFPSLNTCIWLKCKRLKKFKSSFCISVNVDFVRELSHATEYHEEKSSSTWLSPDFAVALSRFSQPNAYHGPSQTHIQTYSEGCEKTVPAFNSRLPESFNDSDFAEKLCPSIRMYSFSLWCKKTHKLCANVFTYTIGRVASDFTASTYVKDHRRCGHLLSLCVGDILTRCGIKFWYWGSKIGYMSDFDKYGTAQYPACAFYQQWYARLREASEERIHTHTSKCKCNSYDNTYKDPITEFVYSNNAICEPLSWPVCEDDWPAELKY